MTIGIKRWAANHRRHPSFFQVSAKAVALTTAMACLVTTSGAASGAARPAESAFNLASLAGLASPIEIAFLPQQAIPGETSDPAIEDPPPPEVFRSNVLGCTVELPPGSRAMHNSLGDASVLRVLDAENDPPDWVTTIRILRPPAAAGGGFGETNPTTPTMLLEAFVADSKAINPDLVFSNQRTEETLAGLPAARATAEYLHSSKRIARYDWYFIQTGPNRFLLVECLADRDRWTGAIFDSLLNSLVVEDEFELADQALSRQERGAAIFRRVDEPALRAVVARMPEEVWYRMHAFDPEGRDVEFGYAGISVIETGRESMGTTRPIARVGDDTGMLVRIRMRQIPQEPNRPFIDVDHRAWLSWDREEEMWSVRVTARQANADQTASESVTGFRPRPTPSEPRRRLEILQQSRNTLERQIARFELPMNLELFLSEAERLVLPTLLDVLEAPEGTFGIYAWNEDRESITRRLESWGPDPLGGAMLESRSYEDGRVATQKVGADGIVSVRIAPTDTSVGGVRWTRMTPAAIRDLYDRKGIRVED